MGMRLVFGLVLLGASLGCVIPVPVTGPDAGGGAGGGGGGGEVVGGGGGGELVEDAGSGGGGGAIEGPCAPISLFQHERDGAVLVPLQGRDCTTSAISITGPAGETVAPVVSPTGVSFAPATPGLYVVTVGTGANAQIVQVEIIEVLRTDAGVLRTYVDRLDACNDTWLTADDRLVCIRGDYEGAVYAADGGLFDRFTGGSVSVAGNVIWSFAYGNLDRRVETPAGLVLEGSVADSQYAGIAPPGEATPAMLMRGRTHFTWDGGTLSAHDPGLNSAILLDGSNAYDEYLCQIRPGCLSTPSCDPFRTCGQPLEAGLLNNGVVVALAAERLWLGRFVGGAQDLAEVRRPVDWAQPLLFRKPPAQFFKLRGKPRPIDETASVAVVATPGGPSHFLVSTEKIIANTPKWIVTLVDPVTLRFTPVR